MIEWRVYIALLEDGRYYVGMTGVAPTLRLARHQQGKGGRFTSRVHPMRILWTESHSSSALASRRERQLKGWSHAKKEALITGDIPRLKRLSKARKK
jgi:putative endonuclease